METDISPFNESQEIYTIGGLGGKSIVRPDYSTSDFDDLWYLILGLMIFSFFI
jgi:hypothetical protein